LNCARAVTVQASSLLNSDFKCSMVRPSNTA
jgi:hypothetical protein